MLEPCPSSQFSFVEREHNWIQSIIDCSICTISYICSNWVYAGFRVWGKGSSCWLRHTQHSLAPGTHYQQYTNMAGTPHAAVRPSPVIASSCSYP
jgi:hypothetical protein